MPDRATRGGVIEVRVRSLDQIFESLDPSPFYEQDLARSAEDYIVESAKEFHTRTPADLVVYVDNSAANGDDERALSNAVREHFSRRARHLRQRLRDLIREGVISLIIGLTFLIVFFVLGQAVVRMLGESAWSTLLRESLLIGGWVAMWRPLEIFLYRWWPLLGERRLHEGLSRMKVRVVSGARQPQT
jgi:hypothetical protein